MLGSEAPSRKDSRVAIESPATGVVTERVLRGVSAERGEAETWSSIPSEKDRVRQRNGSTRFGGSLHAGGRCRPLRHRVRKLLLLLSGSLGATVVSTTTLWAALFIVDSPKPSAYALGAVLVLIRAAYGVVGDPKGLFSPHGARRRTMHVVSDEIQITLVLIAAASVLGWPVSRTAVGVFFLVNLLLQQGRLRLNRMALRIPARNTESDRYQSCAKQVMIVGTGQKARDVADTILDSPQLNLSIKGFLDFRKTGLWRYRDAPLMGHPRELERIVSAGQLDVVVVAVDTNDLPHTRELFDTAEKMGVAVCLIPEIHRPRLATARPIWLNGLPGLVYQAAPGGHPSQWVKGIMDKVGAIVGIVLAAPLMLLTAVAIKMDSSGPILFKQIRCGLNGKPFCLYKFRTMRRDAEKQKHRLKDLNVMSGPVFKAENDPRVTKVGRILRRCSIDEMPQFFNVLRGEMSLVGPRPPLPKEVAQYEPWQRRRLSVKPGVTCLWQVNGRNNIDFEQWMRLDLQYVDNWSLWLDTKILAKTLPAVIKGTGAS